MGKNFSPVKTFTGDSCYGLHNEDNKCSKNGSKGYYSHERKITNARKIPPLLLTLTFSPQILCNQSSNMNVAHSCLQARERDETEVM